MCDEDRMPLVAKMAFIPVLTGLGTFMGGCLGVGAGLVWPVSIPAIAFTSIAHFNKKAEKRASENYRKRFKNPFD